MLKHIIILLSVSLLTPYAYAKAIIDPDVAKGFSKQSAQRSVNTKPVSTIVFISSNEQAANFVDFLKQLDKVSVKKFDSIPAVLLSLPPDQAILDAIAENPIAMQISSFHGGHEELEYSEQAMLLRSSAFYQNLNNWWKHGYTGEHAIVGIIDSGIALEHPSLNHKKIIVRKEPDSGYDIVKNGVRSPHGTGVACIYAGSGSNAFPNDSGIAPNLSTIVTGLAGEGDGNMDDLAQTWSSIDWMLSRAPVKPDVINYSFGNGLTNCSDCPDWSALAKYVDYIVNHYHILWVKSAGNGGFIEAKSEAPFASTMTTPADNYNGITVANMNPTVKQDGSLIFNTDRAMHTIRYTSSRGPTLLGRKKPDLAAPGNDTRTCAPDPKVYRFPDYLSGYPSSMDYHDGYRLMGGTSSATPHVGAAVVLLHDAGITTPMAQKALLINSADAYTDSGKPSPDDPSHSYTGGHHPVMGSEWNRSYGWGYINMQAAFDQRNNLTQGKLTIKHPEKIYEVLLPVGGKITLIHERRVGFSHSKEWRLSHLSIELTEKTTHRIVAADASVQDTVHQVSNCKKNQYDTTCSAQDKPLRLLVKVKLLDGFIDGANEEPYVLASSAPLHHTFSNKNLDESL